MKVQFRFISIALFLFLHCRVFSAQQAVDKEKQAQEKEQQEKYALTAPITATNMHMHATGNNQLRQFFQSNDMLNNPNLRALVLGYVGPQWRPYKELSTVKSDRWPNVGERYGFWRGGQLRFEDHGNRVVLPLEAFGQGNRAFAITWNVETGSGSGDNTPTAWSKGTLDTDVIEQRPAAYI